MSRRDQNYTDVLLEDINSKFELIMEILGPIQEKVNRIPHIEENIEDLQANVKTIKHVVRATNDDLRAHKQLETHLAHGVT